MVDDDKLYVVDDEGSRSDEEDVFDAGDHVHFKCEKGYKLAGSEHAECGKYGSFQYSDDKLPTCESL